MTASKDSKDKPAKDDEGRDDPIEAEKVSDETKAEKADEEAKGTRTKPKGKAPDPELADGRQLSEQQIAEGSAPIAPGIERDVDPVDAYMAKQNRGRGK